MANPRASLAAANIVRAANYDADLRRTKQWIKEYVAKHHYAPTYQEVGDALGITARAAQLRVLEMSRRGWLALHHGWRGIEIREET